MSQGSSPAITAIIPTFRRPQRLKRAINSVLNQTFKSFRVRVYDNASGDETADVVRNFSRKDARVEYVRRKTNIGLFGNFVGAAGQVETPFFCFLPDDDVVLPHFFETALSGFERYPQAALSILATLRMSESGFALAAPLLRWPEGLLMPPAGMLSILRYGNPDLPGLLIRREVWDQFSGWDETTGPTRDMDFELQVSARLPIVVSKRVGGILLIHRAANAAGASLDWVWPALPRMANKLVQDASIPSAARREAAEKLQGWLKRSLITRGILRSIIRGNWEEVEQAANLFLQECGWERMSGAVGPACSVVARLPGTRWLLQAMLTLEVPLRVLRHLDLQWRFRDYSRMLRAPTVEA